MRDLLVLVPDADIEQAMYGLLVRADRIDIAPVDFEIRRHVNRDSGCRTNAVVITPIPKPKKRRSGGRVR